MSTLSDRTIRWYARGIIPASSRGHGITGTWHSVEPMIVPFTEEQLQPASYDLLLDHILDFEGNKYDVYPLAPHEFILGSTIEFVNIPNFLVARIEGKSSRAREGIMVHTAGFIDPGFTGTLTLEITNHSGVIRELKQGMKIAQLAFQELDLPAERPYGHPDLGSHYQGQKGATPSRA